MDIVAVVVTYNRKELLKECLEAILHQTQIINKIIVIDNNSTDNTYEYLEKNDLLKIESVFYKRLDKNIGGAGGFNEGMRVAQQFKPDWLWIMDDDTIPTTDCLKELVKAIEEIEEEKVSYLASSIYGIDGQAMNVPHISESLSDSGYPDWYKYLAKGIVKISTATFVSLLINNNAVKNVGLPVKEYFIWGDDTEYTLRLNKYYGSAYMVGKSIAIHKRKIGKTLSIIDEDNVVRINFYFYKIRNTLLNNKAYYNLITNIRYFFRLERNKLKILFTPKCKYRLKKIGIINKAIFSYMFKTYDKDAFKNRLNNI